MHCIFLGFGASGAQATVALVSRLSGERHFNPVFCFIPECFITERGIQFLSHSAIATPSFFSFWFPSLELVGISTAFVVLCVVYLNQFCSAASEGRFHPCRSIFYFSLRWAEVPCRRTAPPPPRRPWRQPLDLPSGVQHQERVPNSAL